MKDSYPGKTAVILIFLSIFAFISCKTADSSSVPVSSGLPENPVEESSDGASSVSDSEKTGEFDDSQSENRYILTPLQMSRMLKKEVTYRESSFYPVHRKGRLKFIEENLDNTGPSEFFILYACGNSPDETEESFLSDKRNIMEDDLSEKYIAVIFRPVSGKLERAAVLQLKHRNILKQFTVEKLSNDSEKRAVKLSFSGEDGLSDNLITSSAEGIFSVFSMNSTLTEFNRIEDIDNDGNLEILRYENLFEEGLGYETFITLFEYSSGEFRSSGSVSVVRSLKAFLEKSEKVLESKNIDYFLKYSVLPKQLSVLENRGLSSKNIIRKIFYPVKKENELFPDINVFMKNGSRIDFVFPDIVENPFRFDRSNVYNFTTYVKVSSESREEAIYLVKIYMNSNPFRSPLFFFHVN